MSGKLIFIGVAATGLLILELIGLVLFERSGWMDGLLGGGLLGLLGYGGQMLLVKRVTESPLVVLAIMPIKLLLMVGVAYLLLVTVGVSMPGFMIGLANIPVAIGLEGLFGPGSKEG